MNSGTFKKNNGLKKKSPKFDVLQQEVRYSEM